ncbi:glycosyltransferase family 25 protein [Ferrimonas gelatinilytica]|uniref:Glycosyl transferase family 25 domain-containing protein n=1 Tax=Ferrimonas gelatinilytica TaxID=1255257 RepID=A0ABP9S9F5_9GAMM
MSQSAKIYVINLERSKDRLRNIGLQLDTLGLAFERIAAVDGVQLSAEALAQHYSATLNQQQMHRQMQAGEIACYLSHRKVWQKMVDDQVPFAVVLEDDVQVQPEIALFSQRVGAVADHWDVIKLFVGPNEKRVEKALSITPSCSLVANQKVPTSTAAQMVSLEGARKLLVMSERFGRPVDWDIRRWWQYDLRVLGVSQSLAEPCEPESTIDKDSGNRKALNQSVLRKQLLKLQYHIQAKRHGSNAQLLDRIAKHITD